MSLKEKLKQGLIVGVGLGGLVFGGCNILYKDPIIGGLIDTMPRVAQPGGYRDQKEREQRKLEIKQEYIRAGLLPEYDLHELKKKSNPSFLNPVYRGIPVMFSFSQYIDTNGDGNIDFNEFEIKRNFERGDDVNIAVFSYNFHLFAKNESISIRVLKDGGEIKGKRQIKGAPKSDDHWGSREDYFIFNLGNNLYPGVYTVKAHLYNNAYSRDQIEDNDTSFQILD